EESAEIVERSEVRIYVVVIGNVVTVIAHGRWIKREEPERGDAKFLEVIELFDQPAKIADAVAVTVVKGFNMELVDDGVFVPKSVHGWIRRRVRHEANSWRNNRGGAIARLRTTLETA